MEKKMENEMETLGPVKGDQGSCNTSNPELLTHPRPQGLGFRALGLGLN